MCIPGFAGWPISRLFMGDVASTPLPRRLAVLSYQYLVGPLASAFIAPGQYLAAPMVSSFNRKVQQIRPIEYDKYGQQFVSDLDSLKGSVRLPNGVTLLNRIVKAGITDGLCTVEGNPTQKMVDIYARYANGGYGLIISPDTSVSRSARLPGITGNTPVLDRESDRATYTELAKAMSVNGPAVIQLTHPGVVVPFCNRAYAPSVVVADRPRSGLPQYAHLLTSEHITGIIEDFMASAKIAEECGFSGIQIVVANGYLPALFLDKVINNRSDEWAGTAFVTTLIKQLMGKRSNPNFIIGVKFSSEDFYRGGYNASEAVKFVEQIAGLGVDFLEIGGGDFERYIDFEGLGQGLSSKKQEVFFDEFTRGTLKAVSSVPVMTVGNWRQAQSMVKAVKKHANLLVGIGRPTCVDPNIAEKLLKGAVSSIPNWFQVYLPPFVREKIEKDEEEGKKMAFGVEMLWYATAVGSLAHGAEIPLVNNVFDDPLNALTLRIHMLIRSILPGSLLAKPFRRHPLDQSV